MYGKYDDTTGAVEKLEKLIDEYTQLGKDLNIDFSEQIEEMECLKCKYERGC